MLLLAALAGCAFKTPFVEEDRQPSEGAAEARDNVAPGHLGLEQYGLVGGVDPATSAARLRYGVAPVPVGPCSVAPATVFRARAYNQVMRAEIRRRYGSAALDELTAVPGPFPTRQLGLPHDPPLLWIGPRGLFLLVSSRGVWPAGRRRPRRDSQERGMRYVEYRDAIRAELRRAAAGLTWADLRSRLGLPYDRPCPTWTARLEADIGLRRAKGAGRALVWRVDGRGDIL